jgi:hypothetical protein
MPEGEVGCERKQVAAAVERHSRAQHLDGTIPRPLEDVGLRLVVEVTPGKGKAGRAGRKRRANGVHGCYQGCDTLVQARIVQVQEPEAAQLEEDDRVVPQAGRLEAGCPDTGAKLVSGAEGHRVNVLEPEGIERFNDASIGKVRYVHRCRAIEVLERGRMEVIGMLVSHANGIREQVRRIHLRWGVLIPSPEEGGPVEPGISQY